MATFGITRSDLEKRILTPEIVDALKFNIERVRRLQREAAPGIAMLEKAAELVSRPLVSCTVESLMKLKLLITKFLRSEQKLRLGAELKLLYQHGYARFALEPLPKLIQRDKTDRISANPKKTSSAGAEKNRMPVITSGSYITIFRDVNHQLVRN